MCEAAVTRLAGAVEASQLTAGAFEAQSAFPDETARRGFLEEGLDRAIAAWQARWTDRGAWPARMDSRPAAPDSAIPGPATSTD